jgi:hypothetical protein
LEEVYREAVLGLPSPGRDQPSDNTDMTRPTACETRWFKVISLFEGNHSDLLRAHPDCADELALIRTGLQTIGQLIRISPPANGDGVVWKNLVAKAEAERVVLCNYLGGKALFSAMRRLYAAIHRELRDTILPAPQKSTEEFREQRRRKRNPSDDQAKKYKTATPTPDTKLRPPGEVKTQNFYAPLRTAGMEVEHSLVEDAPSEQQQPAAMEAGRPPPIVLTSTAKLLALQKRIREVVTGKFEFRNTRSGTRIVSKEITDFSVIRKFLEQNNLSYFTFFPKSEKPIKAVIRHLPANTPAQDISEALVDLGFDTISVKHMTSRRSKPEGPTTRHLPLFLITLPRTEKSKEVFKLTTLCHKASLLN